MEAAELQFLVGGGARWDVKHFENEERDQLVFNAMNTGRTNVSLRSLHLPRTTVGTSPVTTSGGETPTESLMPPGGTSSPLPPTQAGEIGWI